MPKESALEATWPPAYPPHRAVASAVARALDRRASEEAGIPSLVLMEHAARGVAALATRLVGPGARVLVLAGPGNNGGDGYGVARVLASWGRPVRVLRLARRAPQGDGDAAREAAWSAASVPTEDAWDAPARLAEALAAADLVVDALFGIGLTRDLEPPYPDWIGHVNAARALRLAVDVPSGLDADDGTLRPVAVRAHVTATMAMPKTGLFRGEGPAHAGRVVEIDIGLPRELHAPHLATAPVDGPGA